MKVDKKQNCYYIKCRNGQIRKIYAENDQDAIMKGREIDSFGVVGHLQHKIDSKEINKLMKQLKQNAEEFEK